MQKCIVQQGYVMFKYECPLQFHEWLYLVVYSEQMPCLSVFGCQVTFLAFVQFSSRCLVYLYLLVRLVAVSICPVFKHMPCLSVFAHQIGCSETLSNFQWLYLVVILIIYSLFISVIHNLLFIMCNSELCRSTVSIIV